MARSVMAFAASGGMSARGVSAFVGRGGARATCSPRAAAPVARERRRAYVRMDAATTEYTTETKGVADTMEFRLFFRSSGGTVSPWHDIPIYPDPANKQIVNFVNEIPKGTQAKMEIATDEASNPIKQDVKKGALRIYKYGPSLINYGAIPQTFEDPGSVHPELNVGGDGDPIDLLDVSDMVAPFGAVYPAKILGTLALLDEGEIDWKVIAISTADPAAAKMNDIADVEAIMPGKVDAIRTWFRMYKTAEGKGENEYAYNGEAKDAAFAIQIVEETHKSWAELRDGTIPNDDGLALK